VNLTFARACVGDDGIVLHTHAIDDTVSTVETSICLHAGTSGLSAGDVLLDNQATESIFHNSGLLVNVRRADVVRTFSGIVRGATALRAEKVGDFRDIGTVYYHPDAHANVLSLAKVEDSCTVTYHNGVFTAATADGAEYEFRRSERGLHIYSGGGGERRGAASRHGVHDGGREREELHPAAVGGCEKGARVGRGPRVPVNGRPAYHDSHR
jgi:hypothetical protein